MKYLMTTRSITVRAAMLTILLMGVLIITIDQKAHAIYCPSASDCNQHGHCLNNCEPIDGSDGCIWKKKCFTHRYHLKGYEKCLSKNDCDTQGHLQPRFCTLNYKLPGCPTQYDSNGNEYSNFTGKEGSDYYKGCWTGKQNIGSDNRSPSVSCYLN